MRHRTLQSITKYSIDALCCTSSLWWLQCIRAVEHDAHRTVDKRIIAPLHPIVAPKTRDPLTGLFLYLRLPCNKTRECFPVVLKKNMPTSSERTRQSRSSPTLNHLRKLIQPGTHICLNMAQLCSRPHILQADMSPCSS